MSSQVKAHPLVNTTKLLEQLRAIPRRASLDNPRFLLVWWFRDIARWSCGPRFLARFVAGNSVTLI